MRTQPLRNERRPKNPISWRQPNGSFRYRVHDGDSWISLAATFNVVTPAYLIFFNFHVFLDPNRPNINPQGTDEVNWYLREYVGCNKSIDGGKNWAFSDSASPGIIYIPQKVIDFEGDALVILGSSGVGSQITVPQYEESSFSDTLAKTLDVYGAADLGISVAEIEIITSAEVAMIFAGPILGLIGEGIALGEPIYEARNVLKKEYFFEGFAEGLVMSANGATKKYILEQRMMYTPPSIPTDVGMQEQYRKLHNIGLKIGIAQGKKFNTVDQGRFFIYLNRRLPLSDQAYFSPSIPWRNWSEGKRKEYYDYLSGIVKRQMIDNKMKLHIHN